jgi:hypothetical protein
MFDINTLFPLGWQHYLLGGLTIGAGVALLYLFNCWKRLNSYRPPSR